MNLRQSFKIHGNRVSKQGLSDHLPLQTATEANLPKEMASEKLDVPCKPGFQTIDPKPATYETLLDVSAGSKALQNFSVPPTCIGLQLPEKMAILERSLQASEDRFLSLMTCSGDGILIIDRNGVIQFANPTAETLFQCPAELLIGQSLFNDLLLESSGLEIGSSGWVGEAPGQHQQVMQSSVQLRCHTGDCAIAEMRLTEIEWQGEAAHLVSLRDITQQNRMQEELKQSLALLQATFEATGDGLLGVDMNGRVNCYNRQYIEMWHIPQSIIDTQDDSQILGYVLDQLVDPEAFLAKVKALYANPHTEASDLLKLKDGRVFQRYSRPQLIGETIVGRVWNFHDITDRINTEAALRLRKVELHQKAKALKKAIRELKQAEMHVVQSEKMSSLGQMVAGIAHEINNPINFIHANVGYLGDYIHTLIRLMLLYQQHYPNPVPEVQEELEAADLDFLVPDLAKILSSMQVGTDRIRQIVLSLRNFSRLDEAEMKLVNIHEGIESTLLILQHRLKLQADRPAIQVCKEYGNLPQVECYVGQLNQVLMNILANAIDAFDESISSKFICEHSSARSPESSTNPESGVENEPDHLVPTIAIRTEVTQKQKIRISISDNGAGMSEQIRKRLFDPFFTTKSVGKGTGLGLSISYQIIEKHGGTLRCFSKLGEGTEFQIEIPVLQPVNADWG